jgi:hypothetical protein
MAVLEVYDPEYFVAFTFDPVLPVTLVNAPANCAAGFRGPPPVDPLLAAALAAIPADQPVPANLLSAVTDIANTAMVSCR